MQRLLNQLKLIQQFILLGLLVLLLVAYPTSWFVSQSQLQIQLTQQELQALPAIHNLTGLIRVLQMHRGKANAALLGDTKAFAELPALQEEAQSRFAAASTFFQASSLLHDDDKSKVKTLAAEFDSLRKSIMVRSLSAPTSFSQHSHLIESVNQLLLDIADHYSLSLDPALDTYYLGAFISSVAPRLIEEIAVARGSAQGALINKNVDLQQRVLLETKLGNMVDLSRLALNDLDKVMQSNAQAKSGLSAMAEQLGQSMQESQRLFRQDILGRERPEMDPASFFAQVSRPIDQLYAIASKSNKLLDTLLQQRKQRLQRNLSLTLGAELLLLVLMAYLAWSVSASIQRRVKRANQIAGQIALGHLDNTIPVVGRDEIAQFMLALQSMQNDLRERTERDNQEAANNLRIRTALDSVATNVMIGDPDGQIIYMNPASLEMFRRAEKDICKEIPHFRADAILGGSFDRFHKRVAQTRGTVDSLQGAHRATIKLGGRVFHLVANPVVNSTGVRLGTAVEWVDATQETHIQNEIQTIVAAAIAGDLSQRLPLDNKDGFMQELSAQMNQLLATCDEGLREAQRVMAAISSGDLSQKITRDYAGIFGQLKDCSNNTVDVLGNIVSQLELVVSEANRGNFQVSVNTDGMSGFQREIGESINCLMQTSEAGLGDVSRVLAALAQGDLTESVQREYQGAFAKLKDSSNTTVDSLKRLVGQIKMAVASINQASEEISAGNQDLSQRTDEQASSLEETASSMEQLTSIVKQNADNARFADELAHKASEVAVKGGQVVKQSVQTMANISESSRKIADIIGVIDGIAFQTNILALNAAVEAARAGEQGRGFAVVAGEVRNLAQRSAAAAKEIKTLITDSVHKVESGTMQVNEAGHTMEEIVTAIQQVTQIMAEISSASMEQSKGIEQVNQAITQMDQVTQQNSALVEEAAAATESLHEQATDLAQSVAVFRLERGAGQALGLKLAG